MGDLMETDYVHKAVNGAIAGLFAAVVVDVHAFMRWQRWQEAIAYDWRTAALRWTQGVVVGALTGLGLGI
jgi:hypothetical protein